MLTHIFVCTETVALFVKLWLPSVSEGFLAKRVSPAESQERFDRFVKALAEDLHAGGLPPIPGQERRKGRVGASGGRND